MNFMIETMKKKLAAVDYMNVLIGLGAVFLALLLRYTLRAQETFDFTGPISQWFTDLKVLGFMSGIRETTSNYPPPFLYMLYIVHRIFPNIADVTAVKLPAIAFDFLAAWYVYKLVALKYHRQDQTSPFPLIAFVVFLFSPTLVLNSAYWGQVDSIYTAFLLGCLYYLMKQRSWLACFFFGMAFAVKLQAVFLAPLLVVLLVKRHLSWKSLLAIPVPYFIAIIPALFAGRSLSSLLSLYFRQASWFEALQLNTPNIYTWLVGDSSSPLYLGGIVLTASILFLFAVIVYKSKAKITPELIMQMGLFCLIAVPFFLPKMHERYYFPADTASFVYGFFFPPLFFIPLLVNLVSFFAYQPYLYHRDLIPMEYLALVMLFVLVWIFWRLLVSLYRDHVPIQGSSDSSSS